MHSAPNDGEKKCKIERKKKKNKGGGRKQNLRDLFEHVRP